MTDSEIHTKILELEGKQYHVNKLRLWVNAPIEYQTRASIVHDLIQQQINQLHLELNKDELNKRVVMLEQLEQEFIK